MKLNPTVILNFVLYIMGSSGGGLPSKQIFDQALVVFNHLQARHEETRKNTELQNLIAAVRETVDFFVQDLTAKKYHEYDSTECANSLKAEVDKFLQDYPPDKAAPLEKVLREEGQKLIQTVSKEIGNWTKNVLEVYGAATSAGAARKNFAGDN